MNVHPGLRGAAAASALGLVLGGGPCIAHEPGTERADPMAWVSTPKHEEWIDCWPGDLGGCVDPDGWSVEEAAALLSAYPDYYFWIGNNAARPPGHPGYTSRADNIDALQALLVAYGVDPKRIMIDLRPDLHSRLDGHDWAGRMDGSKGDPPFSTDFCMRVPVAVHDQVVTLWRDNGASNPDPQDPIWWGSVVDEASITALNSPAEKIALYGVRASSNNFAPSSVIMDLRNPAYRAWQAWYVVYKLEDYGITPGEPCSVFVSYKPGTHTWWNGGPPTLPGVTNHVPTLPDGTPTYTYTMAGPVQLGGDASARNVYPTQYGPGEYEAGFNAFVAELTDVLHLAGYEDFDLVLTDSMILEDVWRIIDDSTRRNLHVQGDSVGSFNGIGESAAPHGAPLALAATAASPTRIDLAWDPPTDPPARYVQLDTGFEADAPGSPDADPAGYSGIAEDAPGSIRVVPGSATGGGGANANVLSFDTAPGFWFSLFRTFQPVHSQQALQVITQRLKIRIDDVTLPSRFRVVSFHGVSGAEQPFTLSVQPSVTTGSQAGFHVEQLATTGPFSGLADTPVVPVVNQGDWYAVDVTLDFLTKEVAVSVTNLDDPDPAQSGRVSGHARMDVPDVRSVTLSARMMDASTRARFAIDDWHTEITDVPTWYSILRDGVVVARVPFSVTAWSDPDVLPGSTHEYRVRVAGLRSAGAVPSAVAQATTPVPEDCANGSDDDGDGATDCVDSDCLVDGDGDGAGAAPCGSDCDDAIAAARVVPGIVTTLGFIDPITLAWTDPDGGGGGASTWHALRGRVSELPVGSGPSEQCLDSAAIAPVVQDSSAAPAGDAFYYLVRGVNACSPMSGGPYGADSAGLPRLSSACP